MTDKDTYKTIETTTEAILFKDKNSKFYGFAFPIQSENEVKLHIEDLKKKHHAARHWCYAYQLGTETISFRANDDGEPNNSAGMPIYGQIQSFDVTNILLVIVRYFGGVKLGVSGLINAYKTTAQLTLEASKIVKKTINIEFCITFDYRNINKVMRAIKENNITVTNQKLELDCNIYISVRKKDATYIFDIFNNLFEAKIKQIKS
ncbi:IMPACT family protein [Confluentibacter lentus]|uniref:IMPACT family protein n=1 Tax=Confluentibacter lentus TaxID=1699412 RepID=UPI000C283DA6|nr:YigZ family protein [Confluentibacter lentus]